MCGIQLKVWKDKSCELCQRVFCRSDRSIGIISRDNDTETSDPGFFCRDDDENNDDDVDNLRRRGPDSYGTLSSIVHPDFYRIRCAASVLQMRAELTEQPLSFEPAWTDNDNNNNNVSSAEQQTKQNDDDDDGDEEQDHRGAYYLCWNGEIYQQQSRSSPPSSEETKHDNNNNINNNTNTNNIRDDSEEEAFMYDVADTTLVAKHLRAPIIEPVSDDNDDHSVTSSEQHRASALHRHIANTMSRLYNAEFAFCILTPNGVYYGRDVWGRRSLLFWSCPNNCGSFQLVSVAEQGQSQSSPPVATAGATPPLDGSSSPESRITNNTTPPPFIMEWTEVPPGMVHTIRFSAPPTEKIPAVVYPKVSFPISRLPKEGFVMPVPPLGSTPQSSPNETTATANISERLWRVSLELEFCLRRAVSIRLDRSDRRSTGVLFSGGLDSVVLAALAADVLSSEHRAEIETQTTGASAQSPAAPQGEETPIRCPPVPILYLYTVSFGPNPEKSADRKAALESYNTLREKYKNTGNESNDDNCDVRIILRDIVVEWEDICQTEHHIRTLISPKSTVMDVNIATALWFASRGRLVETQTPNNNNAYFDNNLRIVDSNDRSPRVLLLGMGADELMGGYGRHRKAHERGGWEELKSELTMDQNRLWERNCGRDDRLCSDHGKEARFPFLDAHVVRLLQETMEEQDGLVCDFQFPPGVGDKRILRLVADRLGMKHASGLVKRAIQFGSRVAHLSDKKRFGSRRKAKGSAKI